MVHSLREQQELPPLKIAILGSAPSLEEVPREGWQYWSLMSNFGYARMPVQPDRWFELHTLKHLKQVGVREEELKVASELPNIWMMEPIGKAHRFPKEEVLKVGCNYFTSSIAWVIGLAILQKPHSIGLFGVDLILTKEYERERPCIEYLIGLAQGMGINIEIAEGSPLFKAPLYCDPLAYELRLRREDALKKLRKARKESDYYRGVCDILKDLRFTRG